MTPAYTAYPTKDTGTSLLAQLKEKAIRELRREILNEQRLAMGRN